MAHATMGGGVVWIWRLTDRCSFCHAILPPVARYYCWLHSPDWDDDDVTTGITQKELR